MSLDTPPPIPRSSSAPEHSPLPWIVLADGTHIIDLNAGTVAHCNFYNAGEANAVLTVTAVNSHYKLLAAAAGMLQAIATRDIQSFEWHSSKTKALKVALAEAEKTYVKETTNETVSFNICLSYAAGLAMRRNGAG